MMTTLFAGALACGALVATPVANRPAAPKLSIEEFGAADSNAFYVTSTLVEGPTEVLLWDAQYFASDARRLADRVAATGKHLKAIVISHPDHDHFMGLSVLVERFPGTPVYMTPAALAEFTRTGAGALQYEKKAHPDEAADSLVTPQPLPSNHLTVDGESVEVIPDLTGDVITPTNSALWIPSLYTVLAGDIVFNGIHPWLASSDAASRARWHASLKRLASLHPRVIVAGHKRDIHAPDSPDVLAFMDRYLTDFDAAVQTGPDANATIVAMNAKYPELADRMLLQYSARAAFRKTGAQ
jgi:glyoxylase-like metal-dependent hydrolase (beta-lactamase superfamily II)